MPDSIVNQTMDGLLDSIDFRPSIRARRLSVAVYPDGRVAVTVPPRASDRAIACFLAEHRAWIERQLAAAAKRPDCVPLPGGRRDYLRHKERCRAFVHACLRHHNQAHGFTWNRISIKNLSSRWGSCSESRNLNYNYKVVHLPGDLAEYIVVHELCHLGEMNHSPAFWRLVARTVPDHRQRRKQLNRYLI